MDRDEKLYEDDFYAWTQVQAAKLRHAADARVNLDLDFTNLAEEVEDLGRNQWDAVESALMRVIEHLLKLEHSPVADPRRGWRLSVLEHRRRAAKKLKQNPSLKPGLEEMLTSAWEDARALASLSLREDDVADGALPVDCPYTVREIFDTEWLPANRHGLS